MFFHVCIDQVVDLKKRVRQTQNDATAAENAAAECQRETEELRAACETARGELQDALDEAEDCKREVARLKRERNTNLDAITREQQLYKHLSNARAKAKVFRKTSAEYDAAIREQVNVLQNLNNVAVHVAQNNPQYAPLFDPVAEDINARLAQMK